MKPGEIIKIDGKPYKRVCINPCEFGTELKFENVPLQLEYGKWHDCSQVMPEDFEDKPITCLCKRQDCEWEDGRIPYILNTRDKSENGKWFWAIGSGDFFTHWLAIPPLNKEE